MQLENKYFLYQNKIKYLDKYKKNNLTKKIIISKNVLADAIKFIISSANKYNLKIQFLKPASVIEHNIYSEIPIKLHFIGSYINLINFIRELFYSKYLIKLNKLNIDVNIHMELFLYIDKFSGYLIKNLYSMKINYLNQKFRDLFKKKIMINYKNHNFKFIGIIQQAIIKWALIKLADNHVVIVKVNDYLDKHQWRVLHITQKFVQLERYSRNKNSQYQIKLKL